MITGNEPINSITPYKEYEDDIKRGYPFGLTIRQYYAGLALQGMLANPTSINPLKDNTPLPIALAQAAVKAADALITELTKQP